MKGSHPSLELLPKHYEVSRKDELPEFQQLTDSLPQIIWITRPDGCAKFFNQKWVDYTGLTLAESYAAGWRQAVQTDDLPLVDQMWAQHHASVNAYEFEFRLRRADRTYRWWRFQFIPCLGTNSEIMKWYVSGQDVHDRRVADEAMKALLREKEIRIKEVHHRVKNNLQVITSLLRLQSGQIDHPITSAILGDMQNRVKAMALLHERLYRSENYLEVDLGDYLRQLATQLLRAQAARQDSIRLHCELVATPVGVDEAISCGLLTNELLSNCLKHGFPNDRSGTIHLELQRVADESRLCLRVFDTGVGLPPDFAERMNQSLGLQIVSDLARQLHGELVIAPGPVASFAVTFQSHRPAATAALERSWEFAL